MKRIGLVLAYCNNYGTMLQSYATLKKIQSLGYECEIIRYKKRLPFTEKVKLLLSYFRIGDYSSQLRKIKRVINKCLYPSYRNSLSVKREAFSRYSAKKLLPYFKEYDGYEALKKGSKNYSLVLVGSDQIWSKISMCGGFYNLLFVDDSIPKVSYASSFGVSRIPDFLQKRAKLYLERLDMIGVREHSGKTIVDSISSKKATVVADPSILLSPEEWEEEINNDFSVGINKPYIFCYFLGKNPQYRDAVINLKVSTGCEIVAICHNDEYVKTDVGFGDFTPYNVGPLEFLRYIHEADYVCTDSFHCSVFSILFRKKFLSFYRYDQNSKGSRNSRIDSLLSNLNLESRIYKQDIEKIKEDIDYDITKEKLDDFRKMSIDFLQEELRLARKD